MEESAYANVRIMDTETVLKFTGCSIRVFPINEGQPCLSLYCLVMFFVCASVHI